MRCKHEHQRERGNIIAELFVSIPVSVLLRFNSPVALHALCDVIDVVL